jgi:hypothetical protein
MLMAGNLLTAGEVPEKNKRRSVAAKGAAKKARRSRKKVISQAKACKIVSEGEFDSDRQRKFMHARCEGRPVKRRAA